MSVGTLLALNMGDILVGGSDLNIMCGALCGTVAVTPTIRRTSIMEGGV